jgi:hypothetical protein
MYVRNGCEYRYRLDTPYYVGELGAQELGAGSLGGGRKEARENWYWAR